MLKYSFVGSPDTVRSGLQQFADETGVEELIVASAIYDHPARLRSYEILAQLDIFKNSEHLDDAQR